MHLQYCCGVNRAMGEKCGDKPMMWFHGVCPEGVYHLKGRLLRLRTWSSTFSQCEIYNLRSEL